LFVAVFFRAALLIAVEQLPSPSEAAGPPNNWRYEMPLVKNELFCGTETARL